MFLKGIIHELLWFLNGDTNNNSLLEHNVHIWDEWAAENGDLGPVYGKQWRAWQGKVLGMENARPVGFSSDGGKMDFVVEPIHQQHDQISELIHNLKTKPFSRRHVISAWNVADLPDESILPQDNVKQGKMALAPCHCLFQFYVEELSVKERSELNAARGKEAVSEFADHVISVRGHMGEMKPLDAEVQAKHHAYFDSKGIPSKKLSCQLYQRSADTALGVPYNIASYALLTMMIAQCVDMVPGEFIHTFGDLHLYKNHIENFKEQMLREPYPLPVMKINPEVKDIFSFKFEDFQLEGYQSHPKIEYPISV